jgi:hypothetical protein
MDANGMLGIENRVLILVVVVSMEVPHSRGDEDTPDRRCL